MTTLQNSTNPTFGTIGSVWTSQGENIIPNWGPPTSIGEGGTYGYSGYGYQDGPAYLATYYAATGYLHYITSYTPFTLTANTIYLMPFIPYATHSFVGIHAYVVNGDAGAEIGMGIYGPIHSNFISASNTGILSASSSNTLVSFYFGSPIQLIGGSYYLLAIWGNDSATTIAGQDVNGVYLDGIGCFDPGTAFGQVCFTDTSNVFSGTLPSSLGAFTGALNSDVQLPLLWLGGHA